MKRRGFRTTMMLLAVALAATLVPGFAEANICVGKQTITANVVVLDNPTVFNRLGAQNPNWITYALKRDVIAVDPVTRQPTGDPPGTNLTAGNVELRPDKRTRPLVVRSIAGACLTVNFTNLLAPNDNPNDPIQDNLDNNDQVAGRCASFHAQGVELVGSITEDGSLVGNNHPDAVVNGNCGLEENVDRGSLVAPGNTITYNLYTPHEGTFNINSYGATLGSEQSSGNLGIGMFGQLNVEPKGSRIYRGQLTEEEMRLATVGTVPSDCAAAGPDEILGTVDDILPPEGETVGVTCNPGGQPIINYEAKYPRFQPVPGSSPPAVEPSVWTREGKGGLPILNMICDPAIHGAVACPNGLEIVHSDINAIIAGPDSDGTWNSVCPGPNCPYPLESVDKNNPSYPNRLEPFREFASIFHDEQTNSQVFPRWYGNAVLGYTLAGVRDQFMINYGSGGIGSEIIANRLRTGPMHDCTDCAYEEFFLASQTVGDPGMLVEKPANTGIEQCDPANIAAGPGDPKACWRLPGLANGPIPDNFALFPVDPANVHHAYTGDFVKIRNTHAGAFEQHIFHLHNHQWLFNPNDDNANFLDAQEIMPGSGHTYELVNGGAGNRNKTVGDAIFHCHFYPHFAQGMWYHIRNHDVFEKGTVLAVSNADDPQNPTAGFHSATFALRSGQPAAGARALPDGELPDGSPIPAVVPLPGKAMPQMPAKVTIVAVDRGSHSLLGGRGVPDGIPDSAQAVVDRDSVAGADGDLGTADDLSPGYPFWLAGNECGDIPFPGPGTLLTGNACPQGIVGQRMPTPPLDMLTEAGATANGYAAAQAGGWDGGLPRHALLGYVSGGLSLDTQNRLDFSKIIELAQPVYFPEVGTDLEKVSMSYQSVRERPSAANNLGGGTTPGNFHLNGAPPVPGGPFNDPCIDDAGTPLLDGVIGYWFDGDGVNDPTDNTTLTTRGASAFSSDNPRTYRIANVQIDAVFNKVGYHYPQERIIALWGDVQHTIDKQRPPEPLVMRFNTFDCGKILHANLVPAEFELDDYQVRTPTDILGQHIHLPKWDLTTGDGAANGWNYEDGTLAPGIVQERIHAIDEFNHLAGTVVGPNCTLAEALAGNDDPLTGCPVPGQLAPIDLTDLAPVPTLKVADGADPFSPSLDPTVRIGVDLPDNSVLFQGAFAPLAPAAHPFFGEGQMVQSSAGLIPEYKGARTTIQRILVDPVVNVAGVDRGLGLTFTHDHYGPSSFQQIGLYATILAEPAGSAWVHNETGEYLHTDDLGAPARTVTGPGGLSTPDGGPTSWQAAILTPNEIVADSTVQSHTIPDHREFYFEMSDFQHAYEAGVYVGANATGRPDRTTIIQPIPFNATVARADGINDKWRQSVNPPLKLKSVPFPDVVTAPDTCLGGAPRPCAEAINIGHSSMWVVNYRNEPVGLRVFDNSATGPDLNSGTQAAGQAGDLAFAFQTRTDRAIDDLNKSFGNTPYPPATYCEDSDMDGDGKIDGDLINCDRRPGDPFTPIMRAYERDDVKVKIQVGATEEQHQASIHGFKWLSNGSGFGRSPNSGWRNFQSHGISEQFSLQVPLNPDLGQTGNQMDYLYATDATRDGIWSGTWGILRSYGNSRTDLYVLPDNPQQGSVQIVNQQNFAGVCPVELDRRGRATNRIANLRQYDVTAVLANDVLPNNLGVTIPHLDNVDLQFPTTTYGQQTVGGPLNPEGGTLVYNRRQTIGPSGDGPLHDPTAILYVRTEDIIFDSTYCAHEVFGNDTCRTALGDPVGLQPGTPVEPLVLRANAGDCIEVTLRNALPFTAVEVFDPGLDLLPGTVDDVLIGIDVVPDPMPDLAGWQDVFWVVNRDLFKPLASRPLNQMHFFNNNLIRPSSYVGLHPQLVEYDASRDAGVLVGQNSSGMTLVGPAGQKTYRWYAGDLRNEKVVGGNPNQRQFEIKATPVEFGGTNLLSADRVKQPQKGLFGALVIEPAGAAYPDTLAELEIAQEFVPDNQGSGDEIRLTRAQATVSSELNNAGSGGIFREALLIGHKISNLRWADGTAIPNIHQGELGREGAEDSGHAGFNYAAEPSWFRFQLLPDAPFGNAGTAGSFGSIPNVHAFYANGLVADGTVHPNTIPEITVFGHKISELGDPVTPVFYSFVNQENPVFDTRMHVLNGASADRDGVFILHGHVWQRDPYVCPGQNDLGLTGRCDPDEPVPSRALGYNLQGKWMGGEEGMGHVYGHWPILFDAGGTDGVPGDYLFRDYSPSGNRNGQFGILRVEIPQTVPEEPEEPKGKGPKKNR